MSKREQKGEQPHLLIAYGSGLTTYKTILILTNRGGLFFCNKNFEKYLTHPHTVGCGFYSLNTF